MTSIDSNWANADSWGALILRLGLASLIGGAIGWDRQTKGKAAGLRTHMLVSLGAALFVLIPLEIGSSLSSDAVSRAIQGVATGVGFLGAGEIVHQQRSSLHRQAVRGLTSAAAIWVTAALGMVVACGLWKIALVATLLTLLILRGAKQIEKRITIVDED